MPRHCHGKNRYFFKSKSPFIATACGYTISPNCEDELVSKLIYLADNDKERNDMGSKGTKYARCHFDKDILSTQMIQSIEELYNNS